MGHMVASCLLPLVHHESGLSDFTRTLVGVSTFFPGRTSETHEQSSSPLLVDEYLGDYTIILLPCRDWWKSMILIIHDGNISISME